MTFVKKQSPPLSSLVLTNLKYGLVGMEIEVEGTNLPKNNTSIQPYWVYHTDGSLRGEDNAEYVLREPLSFEEVPKALDFLWSLFARKQSQFDESNRTSVHIHLNCQDFHLNRLTSFAALYFTLEELLTEWCGDHRVGNLFCLRAKDAPNIITQLKSFINKDGQYSLNSGLHYSAFNIAALQKFGSIEIRTMRGVSDKDVILRWVNILKRLYDLSEKYKDPRDIPGLFSSLGPQGFLHTVLGEETLKVQNDINWTSSQVYDSLYEGIRIAQDLCYCRDWDLFEEFHPVKDPFNRIINNSTVALHSLHYTLLSSEPQEVLVSYNEEEEEEDEYDDDE